LQEHAVERQICLMLQEILTAPPEGCSPDVVERNLLELGGYFLETGDFACLAGLCRRIGQVCEAGCGFALQEVGAFFTNADFIETVLNGFSQWGKCKYGEIRLLIKQVGVPFVEPLIVRLAEESTLSIRRTYLDALLDLGEAVRDPAIAHLNDTRWYVVRNMILVLRNLDDRSLMIHFRRLKNYPHPRVRGEILKTLQHFSDPETDRLLLQYMDGADRELRISAIALAEYSSSRAVFSKLLELAVKGGIAGFDTDVRVAAIRTLAQKGNPAALPAVKQLIESKSRLRPAALHRIKVEAVRSLGGYPGDTAVELLRSVAGSGHAELALLAQEMLQGRTR
jgi:HEAT repeat protein